MTPQHKVAEAKAKDICASFKEVDIMSSKKYFPEVFREWASTPWGIKLIDELAGMGGPPSMKIAFTDCWEMNKDLPEEARWMGVLDSFKGMVVTARTKDEAFNEIITSLKVLCSYESGHPIPAPSPTTQGPEVADLLEWVVMFYGALHELVELKDTKDIKGKTADYLERQPKAWYLAKQAIKHWDEDADYGAKLHVIRNLPSTPTQGPNPRWVKASLDALPRNDKIFIFKYGPEALHQYGFEVRVGKAENMQYILKLGHDVWYLDESASGEAKREDGLTVEDYEEVIEDHNKLVRELDVIINGDNAAKQASLCDIVAQCKTIFNDKK